jgi:ElaA protein
MTFYAKKFDELTTRELYEILRSRAEIFVVEQKISYVDMDGIDYNCLHCFIEDRGRVTACLRAFYDEDGSVKIGRVLTLAHGGGLGRRLMERSLEAIREKLPANLIYVNAQEHAVGFYEKLGFVGVSEVFYEENIPHIRMELK